MGAENRDVAPDELVRGQSTDLAVTFHCPHSMISRRGLPTRLPDARPRRHSQERGEPGTPTRDRRATSTQPAPPAMTWVDRALLSTLSRLLPVNLRRLQLVTENAAALARPAGRPALDVSATTTGPSTRRATHPGVGAADGPGEPEMGLPQHPGRAGRTRPSDCHVDGVEGPQRRGHRPPRGSPDRSGDSSWPRRPTRSSTVVSGVLGLAVRQGAIASNPALDIGRIASTPPRQPRGPRARCRPRAAPAYGRCCFPTSPSRCCADVSSPSAVAARSSPIPRRLARSVQHEQGPAPRCVAQNGVRLGDQPRASARPRRPRWIRPASPRARSPTS